MRWDIRRFEEIDSTNRYLTGLARSGAPAGVVAVADHQTAGRGRLGRTWTAPPGSALLVSILLRPGLPADRLHLTTAAVALAAADALDRLAGFRPDIKWPNDLLVEDRKLAGVLAEADGDAVVVGIGVNLNRPADLPDEIGSIAAYAGEICGRPLDRDDVLAALLDRLAALVGDWDAVADRYGRECATIGRTVRVQMIAETFSGTAVGVTPEGHLVVEAEGGGRRVVTAGDVVHLRPT